MPIRRRTRAQDQAQRNAYERALNEAELQKIADAEEAAARRHAAREAARQAEEQQQSQEPAEPPPADSDIPPPL